MELRERIPSRLPFSSFSTYRYLTTKEQFHEFLEAARQEKPSREPREGNCHDCALAEPEAKRIRLKDGQLGEDTTEEAAELGQHPQAQKRARGQNKGRPHLKPTHYDKNRLCPSLVQVSVSCHQKVPEAFSLSLSVPIQSSWCCDVNIIFPIFQMKKLRHSEVTELSQDPQPGGEGSDSKPGCPSLSLSSLTASLFPCRNRLLSVFLAIDVASYTT